MNSLWALGGFAELTEILELVTPALSGGDIEIAPILAAVLPLFENFYHGIYPGIEIGSDEFPLLDKIVDVDDINGNDDMTDLVADLENFTEIDFAATQAQNQSATVTFPSLPAMGDGCADSIIALAGTMQTGVGFIPLGLTAAMDEVEGTFDCEVEGATMAFAPQHSGVSGYDYYFLSVALSLETLLGGVLKEDAGIDISGSVFSSAASPSAVTFPAYLDFMSDAAFDGSALTATAVAGASFHRVVFRNDNYTNEARFHHVYWPGDGSGFTLALPAAVTDDRTDGYSSASLAQAIKTDGVDYNTLFGFNDTNADDMNSFIESFSMHALPTQASK